MKENEFIEHENGISVLPNYEVVIELSHRICDLIECADVSVVDGISALVVCVVLSSLDNDVTKQYLINHVSKVWDNTTREIP